MASRGNDAPAIGIDLGTTYSCVGVWKDDRIEIIANEQGNRTTPSSVAFLDTQQRLIGDAANNQLPINPANTIFDAKRLIGRRFSDCEVQENMKLWPFRVIKGPADTPKIVVSYNGQEKGFSAEEISSMVLGKMKEIAEAYVGNVVTNAVITVPAYFNDSQRQVTKEAGIIAGLNILRVINEPMAAAIAYGLDNKSSISGKINVLIFDLGGGTLDICLSTFEEGGIFEVKSSAGDTHLGGQDFDSRMVDLCVEEFKRRWNKDLTGNQRALGRLRLACEKAKRILSSTSQTLIELDSLHEGIDFSMEFTRAKFEELNMSLFNNCIKTLEKCLKDADMEKSLVDEILLVGGSTKIPKIQLMLQELFNGKKLCKSVNPDEAVAYGAAVMAAKLCGKSVPDVRRFDITPLSLGVEVRGEVFSIVIPQNTAIPWQSSKNYTTTLDNQTSILFKVYQGERSRSTDNYLLGKLRISGIPPAPKKVPSVKVMFEIDADDKLTVTAEMLSTGKKEKLVISHVNGGRRKEEIEKMAKDAEMHKLEDQEHVKNAKAYNALEDYVDDMKKKVKEFENKKTVHPKCLKKMKNAIADTEKWLKNNKAASAEKLESKKVMLKIDMEALENEKKLSWFGRLLCFN